MTELRQVIGPPGTGKTTYLSAEAKDAVGRYGSKRVMICSLTRAAAFEVGSRGTQVEENCIGTLHAHAYRALNRPKLAEANLASWNEDHEVYPVRGAVRGGLDDPADEVDGVGSGDKLLHALNNLRAAEIPPDEWPPPVKKFHRKWVEWKKDNDFLDFSDLIEVCCRDVPVAPGDPMAMLGDEAQDWSALETRLFRDVWGKAAGEVIMVGDPDQTIYSWRGANPRIFMDNPVDDEHKKILSKSYRVPKAVHAAATKWIRQIDNREDVLYHPTAEEGACEHVAASFRKTDLILREIEQALEQGESFMILASCGFMLQPIIKALRAEGLPFHNPYRRAQAAWNPLVSRGTGMTAADRLLCYMAPEIDPQPRDKIQRWTQDEFKSWASLLRSGDVLKNGIKKKLGEEGVFPVPTTLGGYDDIFVDFEEHHEAIMTCDLDWLENSLLDSKRPAMQFPIDVVRDHGIQALDEEPQVIVGTIHSVKGGEADNVLVFPDMSPVAMRGYEDSQREHDAAIRLFYVAMTRAKRNLLLGGRSTINALEWL